MRAGILWLMLTGALYAQQQTQQAKLTGFRDTSTQNVTCLPGRGAPSNCSGDTVRLYTLEIGKTDYEVEAYNGKVRLSLGLAATRGPLYDQPMNSDWQVTMEGKDYIRVFQPNDTKGYRFLIVAAHAKS